MKVDWEHQLDRVKKAMKHHNIPINETWYAFHMDDGLFKKAKSKAELVNFIADMKLMKPRAKKMGRGSYEMKSPNGTLFLTNDPKRDGWDWADLNKPMYESKKAKVKHVKGHRFPWHVLDGDGKLIVALPFQRDAKLNAKNYNIELKRGDPKGFGMKEDFLVEDSLLSMMNPKLFRKIMYHTKARKEYKDAINRMANDIKKIESTKRKQYVAKLAREYLHVNVRELVKTFNNLVDSGKLSPELAIEDYDYGKETRED